MTISPPRPSFAELLKRYRGASRLTQEMLAERAGLSREAISALERGERQYPRADTVDLLVRAMGLADADHAALLAAARQPIQSRNAPPRLRLPGLPLPPTPILGRAAELASACTDLTANGARLLTLTGPGGVGKTRLALEIGATCGDRFSDGAVFVPLASLSTPSLLADTLAHVVGAVEQGERPAEEVLIEHLRDRHMLMILDNFEHLLAAAPVLATVLAACQRLALLVTSRAIIHVRGEQSLPVSPLAVPRQVASLSLAQVAASPAVALFLERVHAVRPDFQLTPDNAADVAAVCRRVDGLPLAIELAAARIRVLPPRALLERLERRLPTLTAGPRDLPARHQTLRGALAWSYDLLAAPEQSLFRRMSVFAGGATLAAVETVCKIDDAFSGVAALVDHALLQRQESVSGSESRVGMLETMRDYARSLVLETGEQHVTEQAHALYFVELAETAETELLGPQNSAWMARLELEIDNLRAALEWTAAHGAHELRLRLAGALWYFWFMSWRLTEGRHWLSILSEPAADDLDDAGPVAVRARTRAFAVASFLAFNQGDYAEATTLADRGLALHRRAPLSIGKDDRAAQAYALTLLGLVVGSDGRAPQAREVLEQALTQARASGDRGAMVMALRHLGIVARWHEEYADAERYLRECAAESRAMSRYREYLVAWGQSNLARTIYLRGGVAESHALLEETLTFIQRSSFAGHTLADSLDWLAAVYGQEGDTVRAARLFGAAAAQWRSIDAVRFPLDRAAYERDVDLVRARLDEASFAAAWAEGEAMHTEQAIKLAVSGAADSTTV